MDTDRCPTCNAPLPAPRTCAWVRCGKTFYWGESGRTEAIYCSARCRNAAGQQRHRDRQKQEAGR